MSQVQFNTQLTDQINVSDEAVKQLLALTENEEYSFLVAVVVV